VGKLGRGLGLTAEGGRCEKVVEIMPMPGPFEAWFSFRLAAETVERRLGVNSGMAQKLLLEAIESGVIRSQRDESEEEHPLGPSVWSADFEDWIEMKQKPKQASPQQDLAREAINAIWPDGNMPKITEMVKPIADWVPEHHKGRSPPSRDSVRRAVAQIRNARHASPLAPDT
jgi:hypothetical protein